MDCPNIFLDARPRNWESSEMKARLIGKPGSKYHVISRFVDRKFAMGDDRSKRIFAQIMFSQAAFTGVEILTYCIMSNHFHILLRIPERPESGLDEQEVLRRLGKIWKENKVENLKATFATMREVSVEGDALVERELDRFRRRMFDLSEFMKDVKQRFSTWYNQANERKGTLFEERFKSVLVQDGQALRMMAAYIDLNPVRAGIVSDPADYLWCGYALAVSGNQDRRRGLRTIMTDPQDTRPPSAHSWKKIAKRYRLWLHERGLETHHRDGRQKKRGFSRTELIATWDAKGAIPPATLLRCKARCMTEALIYGDQAFVEKTIVELRGIIPGKRPRPNKSDDGLCTLVNLRKEPAQRPCAKTLRK